MTRFFATAAETGGWLHFQVERLRLRTSSETLPGGLTRTCLWPQDASLPTGVLGVQVRHPEVVAEVLGAGSVGWKASAFPDDVAQAGRSLVRSLTRSLRKEATVPLFAMSLDGTSIDKRPTAWGTAGAVGGRWRLREFPTAGCYFVTAAVSPPLEPLPPEDDRSLYEGDGRT